MIFVEEVRGHVDAVVPGVMSKAVAWRHDFEFYASHVSQADIVQRLDWKWQVLMVVMVDGRFKVHTGSPGMRVNMFVNTHIKLRDCVSLPVL